MTTAQQPKMLTRLFTELVTKARQTGMDQARTLSGGTRIAVRVRDGWVLATFSRLGVDVSAVEEATARRDCGVPDTAERIPRVGQGLKAAYRRGIVGPDRHYVAYSWKDEAVT